MARGRGRSSRNNAVSLKGVSTETVVIVVLLIVLLVLVVYYVRQNTEGFTSAEQCTIYAFVADWCPHCKNAKPAIENLKNNSPNNVNVEVVNEADNNSRDLIKKYGVRGFPTILLIKADGTVVEFEQRVTESNLNNFVANNANVAANNGGNNFVNNLVNNGGNNRVNNGGNNRVNNGGNNRVNNRGNNRVNNGANHGNNVTNAVNNLNANLFVEDDE